MFCNALTIVSVKCKEVIRKREEECDIIEKREKNKDSLVTTTLPAYHMRIKVNTLNAGRAHAPHGIPITSLS